MSPQQELAQQLLNQARQEASAQQPQRKSLRSPVDEAANALEGKMAKLALGREAVLLDDLRELAKEDRRSAKRAKEKFMYGKDPGPDMKDDGETGDIIIADDVHWGNTSAPRPNPAIPWLLAAALVAGGGGVVAYLTKQPPQAAVPVNSPQSPAAVVVKEPLDEVTYELLPDGRLGKEISRKPYKR